MRTFSPKPADIHRVWHVVDAENMVLGRLSSEVARVLRGKHKPIFAPHVDTGDHVVVVNASKVVMTADKASAKFAYRHSGYPGGLRREAYSDLLATKPEETVRRAIRGMLPRGTLGRQMLTKLKVYAGPDHPHDAQRPQPLALPSAQRPS
ncbi:MAG: 50S ribosomal protein L13 [Acidimicrobiales bacterium]